MKHIYLLFSVLIFSTKLSAELSPATYKSLQEKAQHILYIQVLSVSTKPNHNHSTIRAKAKILQVFKSSSLKVGKTIFIQYNIRKPNPYLIAPAPIPILKKSKYKAYLNKDNNIYKPAALSHSFTLVKDLD
jgi:hypothetical protein